MNQLTLEALAERVESLERKVADLTRQPSDDMPGTTGDPQHNDPKSITRWIAAADAIPPLQMTPEEEAAWQVARAEQKRIDADAHNRLAARLSEADE